MDRKIGHFVERLLCWDASKRVKATSDALELLEKVENEEGENKDQEEQKGEEEAEEKVMEEKVDEKVEEKGEEKGEEKVEEKGKEKVEEKGIFQGSPEECGYSELDSFHPIKNPPSQETNYEEDYGLPPPSPEVSRFTSEFSSIPSLLQKLNELQESKILENIENSPQILKLQRTLAALQSQLLNSSENVILNRFEKQSAAPLLLNSSIGPEQKMIEVLVCLKTRNQVLVDFGI